MPASAHGPLTPPELTRRHYDLPPEVFASFLDRRLKYSSGLYGTADTTLDEAQTAKLRFVADQLGVRPDRRVLDVGCGWGSLMLFLAEEYGCRVTGVTPSAVQAEYIAGKAAEAGLAENIHLRVGSFSELEFKGKYDAVALLGSIVHMPDRTAVMRKTFRALHAHGRMYLSESCFRNQAVYEEFARRPGTRHVLEQVFGFADMVPASVLIRAIEDAGFSLTGLTDLTAHYLRTTTDWRDRAAANADSIDAVVPGLSRELVRYLDTASAGWGYTTKHYAITTGKSRM